jgi:hypothetical protein
MVATDCLAESDNVFKTSRRYMWRKQKRITSGRFRPSLQDGICIGGGIVRGSLYLFALKSQRHTNFERLHLAKLPINDLRLTS